MNLGHGLRVLLEEDKEQNREISVFNDLILLCNRIAFFSGGIFFLRRGDSLSGNAKKGKRNLSGRKYCKKNQVKAGKIRNGF